jgi:hypothetical protein
MPTPFFLLLVMSSYSACLISDVRGLGGIVNLVELFQAAKGHSGIATGINFAGCDLGSWYSCLSLRIDSLGVNS